MSAVLSTVEEEAAVRAANDPVGAGDGLCFHCGSAVLAGSRWQAEVDGVARSMCCPGCAAAAEAIVAGGLKDYYRARTEYGACAAGQHDDPVQLAQAPLDQPDAGAAAPSCAPCARSATRPRPTTPGATASAWSASAAPCSASCSWPACP